MNNIKSFIYLDSYKVYSISSQIFEGLTEYIINEKKSTESKSEEQKGPIASGRLLGDIIASQDRIQEKKFLHDFSFNLFEDKLKEENKILMLDENNVNENIKDIGNYSFIKVTGKLVFKDIKLLIETIKSFNETGEALAYMASIDEKKETEEKISELLKGTNDREQRNKIKTQAKINTDIKKIAKDAGLTQDKVLLDKMAYLLEYGYKDLFEVYFPTIGDYLFSAILKRENIIENEHLLIKKYSRKTEKDFTLFGMITQSDCRGPKVFPH
jgi:hypothetical protein